MNQTMIRVLLVDDQRLMREGLQTLLSLEEDIIVVAEAENGQQALHAFAEHAPDVVLMDIRMPVMNGVTATQRLLEEHPQARIIILTTFDDDDYVFDALRAGALGYLLKDVSGSELASAIRTVSGGGALIEPSVARKVLAEFSRLPNNIPSEIPDSTMSKREREILSLIAQGMSNKQIAGRLFLAEGTVKNYVSSILQKLGVEDRTQAALLAREKGWV